MTDDRFRTRVETDAGVLEFQDYFVRQQWQPVVKRVILTARSRRELHRKSGAAASGDAIIFCPSNPFVSIEPILTLLPLPFRAGAGVRAGRIAHRGRASPQRPGGQDVPRGWASSQSAFAVAQRYRKYHHTFRAESVEPGIKKVR